MQNGLFVGAGGGQSLDWYVFSRTTDFAVLLAGHGLEARATTARMAVPRRYFARLNTYFDWHFPEVYLLCFVKGKKFNYRLKGPG